MVKGESSIAYSLEIPLLTEEESTQYLRTLADHFLTFLKKESEKACDFVRFGGIRFERTENNLTLLAAFCPFEQRNWQPKATLILDEAQRISDLKTEKRSRRNSP